MIPNPEILPVVAALVALSSELGAAGKVKILLSVIYGAALQYLAIYEPEFYSTTLPILIMGLVTSGFYDLGETVIEKVRSKNAPADR